MSGQPATWWSRRTVLYPHAGVAIIRTAVGPWSWKRVRALRPHERCGCGLRPTAGMHCHACPLVRSR